MAAPSIASWLVSQEARALSARLARVKPFALQETMLPAAALSTAAQTAIELYLAIGRRRLRQEIDEFIDWAEGPEGTAASPESIQRRYATLRLKFNVVLSQFDLFSEALSQRSERDHGLWLAGLDIAAADGLALPSIGFSGPPVVCYLSRGLGGAIRRARTRLPGGGANPVALVMIPRERMIGAGLASSLYHEVGHQSAALLGLVDSTRQALRARPQRGSHATLVARLFHSWMSEVVADLWAIARVGIVSTLGLISTVTLPRRFVFRFNPDDPHPTPWLRVLLSSAIGQALYPHPQWRELADSWRAYYPPRSRDLDPELARVLDLVGRELPAFVEWLLAHRAPELRGATLGEALHVPEHDPRRLSDYLQRWRREPILFRRAAPSRVFAVFGQARFDGRITPEEEDRILGDLLAFWALRGTIDGATLRTALQQRLPAVQLAS
jgi:hypothetical protein